MYWLKQTPVIFSLILLGICLFLKSTDHYMIERLQFMVFDSYQRIKPRQYTPQPVKIIDIDEESLAKIGQWPWPRTKMAELVDKLSQAGAESIAFDITFAEKDRTSPNQIINIWGKKGHMEDLMRALPDHDEIFAKSIANADNVVTSFILTGNKKNKGVPFITKSSVQASNRNNSTENSIAVYSGAITSLEIFEKSAKGNGTITGMPDNDGTYRRMNLLNRIDGAKRTNYFPSIMAEALRIKDQNRLSNSFYMADTENEFAGYGRDAGVASIKIGDYMIPTESDGSFWIYYTGHRPERYIPAWKILEGQFKPENIKNVTFFVGTSSIGLKDIRITPLDKAVSGVEVHVEALEQVLTGQFLRRFQYNFLEYLSITIAALLVIFMTYRFSALLGAIFALTLLAGVSLASWVGFSYFLVLIDPVVPSITILLIFLTCSISKHISEEKQKKQIRNAFSHYMSPVMVKKLVENPDQLQLGGETKTLTVLFCDIRGFTSISENFNAQDLTQFINRFLTPMTDIILSNQGTIDKYMGDAIMAFWNAPLDDDKHANNGCLAALEMLKELAELNKDDNYPEIKIGIGLNTGQCCVGNMGSEQRFDYSVLGDEVNLASRLEGQSKTYGVDIVIGAETQKMIKDMATIELDFIKVKGKEEAVTIYGLLGDTELAQNAEFKKLKELFHNMLDKYRNQKWDEALDLIKQCEKQNLDLSILFDLYRDRISEFRTTKLTKDWDGVYTATSK